MFKYTCPFFVVSCRSIVSGLVFPTVGSPLGHASKRKKLPRVITFTKTIGIRKLGPYVLSRKRMAMLFTSASETSSLIIPPESISIPDTYRKDNSNQDFPNHNVRYSKQKINDNRLHMT